MWLAFNSIIVSLTVIVSTVSFCYYLCNHGESFPEGMNVNEASAIRETNEKIDRLLKPGSVAVVGASNTEGKVGHIIFRNLLKHPARLYPVNPKEKEVFGFPAYPTICDLPEKADVAVICLDAGKTVQVAEECAGLHIENIIIVAGGFGETGEEGRELERRLKALPGQYGCRVLGPNSLGVFFPENGFDTIFVEHGDQALASGGGIAFITQSGSVGVESLGLASNTGFGMRAFIGLGNKADLNELDFLRYFGADDKTTCVALYVE
ncbi:MAG: hypothetical protein E4H36_05225, partial [Spirochaetales bacterium]